MLQDGRKWFYSMALVYLLAGCAHSPPTPTETQEQKQPEQQERVVEHESHEQQTHSAEWGYHGDIGPENWGTLKPEFATCAEGEKQSPVNIVPKETKQHPDPPALNFEYKTVPLTVLNNGHTLQAGAGGASIARVGDEAYPLLQTHFHAPSENTIDGESLAGELHFVHKEDEQLLVVAVMLVAGEPNPAFGILLEHAPESPQPEIVVDSAAFNPAELLPDSLDYYHFEGSLTTPPCTEGVKWYVLKQPVAVSEDQLAKFTKIIGPNARPTLPLNGRSIYAK